MHRAPNLCTALAALAALGCGADDCTIVCQTQRGVWQPRTDCTALDLAEMRWEVTLGVSGAQCDVNVAYCAGDLPQNAHAALACESRLAAFRLGDAECALHATATEVGATCRKNGQTCNFGFVKVAGPSLGCAPQDAGADAPDSDTAAPDAGADMPDAPAEAAGESPQDGGDAGGGDGSGG